MKKSYNLAFSMKSISNLASALNKRVLKDSSIKLTDGTDEFAEILNKELPIDSFRIPGGTVSFEADISAEDDGDQKTNKYTLIPNPKNYLYLYAKLIKKLDNKPKTIVCLNIFRLCTLSNFLDGTENTLLYLKEAVRLLGSENIYAVELGNELYMHKACNGILGNLSNRNRASFTKAMQKYQAICNYLIPEIKKICPYAIICVPVEGCMSERGNEWNKGVIQIKEVTGICPHFYCDSIKNVDEELRLKTSIRVKDEKKTTIQSLQSKFKILATEYNYKFGSFGKENKSIFGTEKHYQVINRIQTLGTEMGFDTGCFHSLLQEIPAKVYGQFVIQDNKIQKRFDVYNK